ncbi:MAG: hypothetical protein ACI841_001506, partial [Planctomycetota bacterium]
MHPRLERPLEGAADRLHRFRVERGAAKVWGTILLFTLLVCWASWKSELPWSRMPLVITVGLVVGGTAWCIRSLLARKTPDLAGVAQRIEALDPGLKS